MSINGLLGVVIGYFATSSRRSPQRLPSVDSSGLDLSLIGEHVEDLLQGCLGHTVFADVVRLLHVFHQSKQVADGIVVSAHLDLPGVPSMFNDLELLKHRLKVVDDSVALRFNKLPFHKLSSVDGLLRAGKRLVDF